MYEIAKLPSEEREILFQNTAARLGMNAAIIEKDFWVCLTLDYLFHHCKWKQVFAFKGGTSLSKVYGLIDRFSEDIDLILDWRTVQQLRSGPSGRRRRSCIRRRTVRRHPRSRNDIPAIIMICTACPIRAFLKKPCFRVTFSFRLPNSKESFIHVNGPGTKKPASAH